MSGISTTAGVIEIIPETPEVLTLRLERPFTFKAGQSVQVCFPGDPKKRFYSISSSPLENNHLDLTIKSERGSPLYQSLFMLKKGSPIEVLGPYGKFSLPEDLTGPFYFLAGGTGVSPFRSMIKWLQTESPKTECWLFHSVRTPDDLIFRDEFLTWGTAPGVFHYVPTFSRYSGVDAKQETGRIGQGLLNKHLPGPTGTFFLCGPSAFVNDLEHLLKETMNIEAERIRREQW